MIGLLFVAAHSRGQQAKPPDPTEQLHLGVGAGLSLSGLQFSKDQHSDTVSYTASTGVTWTANGDYFVNDKVSLGVQTSMQRSEVFIQSWLIAGSDGTLEFIENSNVRLTRVYLGTRTLFHYKNTSKTDLYSGIRAGTVFWLKKWPDNQAFRSVFGREFPAFNHLSLGIIAFGCRYKITPRLAAAAELNLGAPYLITAGGSFTLIPR